ncbi:PDxFFG protein [Mycoplasmopsis citelli]|uniref:PDxFFG protein n=1 Tax=Mycoplasmopsis citelli TaxID=171281 RepID=UPI0021143CDC|nr:PDxFFG protein [Mycoplasmopsis citelli]UUD36503.1 PDxFFG protein [Mycoplasmopsis citelli]
MKRKLKLSLLQKTLLAVSTVVIGSGATLGAMLAYSNNSDEVLGSYSAIPKNLLKNDYSLIRDENGNLKAEVNIVDPLKQRTVAKMSDDGSQYWFVNDEEHKMNFSEFFNAYYKRFQESFIQEIKYGSFNFYNEYVLAVRPERFLEFSKWFIDNVAWGPDLLTLSSFRIVPGVERKGNSVTLGNHSTLHKESSEIKFFPDAFFGAAPIFSNISGESNAPDALTDNTFPSPVSKFQADGFLENIAKISIVKNSANLRDSKGFPLIKRENILSFKNIFFVGKLKGQKVKVLVDPKYKDDYRLYNQELKNYDKKYQEWFFNPRRNSLEEPKIPSINSLFSSITNASKRVEKITALQNAQNLVFPADITEEEFNTKIKEFGNQYQGLLYKDLVEYEITQSRGISDSSLLESKASFLALDLSDGQNQLTISFLEGISSPSQYYAEQLFEQMANAKIKNFLDFYDMDEYVGTKVYLYQDQNHKVFYPTDIQARNSEEKFEEDNLKKLTVKGFDLKNKVLAISLEHKDKDKDNKISQLTETFEAIQTDKDLALSDLFRSFKYSVGYRGAVVPRTLTSTAETLNEVDKKGNLLKGIDSRKFEIYTDAYNGLLDEISQKFPFLLKKQSGPHISKKIDENGVYKYTIEDGEYVGFSPDDNIGIPMILANTIKNYKGVSYDFLKYVGAHEYGHHYTLEKGQAIDQRDSAVLVGGIPVRSGASDSSYYSYQALKNYIEARTNLLVRRVDAKGEPNPRGSFTQFGYIKNDGTHTRWETFQDVWGTKSNDIFDAINNKNRRFIQSFEGLQKSAEKRNIRVGDLFLANSLDSNSGTLNPFIEGVGKVIYNENGNKSFKTITLSQMLSQFRDGLGNPIEFTGDSESNIEIKFFDSETDDLGRTKITKFKIFNKDGSPVIKAPLNTFLTQRESEYVRAEIKKIQKNIISLYQLNNFDNGWNNRSTSVDEEVGFEWKQLGRRITPKSFYDSILYRSEDPSNEFNPESNALPWLANSPAQHVNPTRKSNLYYAVLNDNSASNFDILSKMIQSQIQNGRPEGVGFAGFLASLYYSDKVLTFVDSKNSLISSYVFPVGAKIGLSATHKLTNDRFNRSYELSFGQKNNSSWQPTPAYLISEGFGISNGNINRTIDLTKNEVYFLGIDNSNKEITDYSKPNITLSKVGYNYSSKIYSTLETTKLTRAFSSKLTLFGASNSKPEELKLPVFDTFKDMFEFGSVDYSKATYVGDEQKELYNWDINYVKTKFDLNKFKVELEKEENLLNKNTILGSEQLLANEIMKRFINSPLLITLKDFKLKDLEKNRAIFSTDYGLNFLNDSFNRSFVKTNSKPQRARFNIIDLLKGIRKTLSNYYDKSARGKYSEDATRKAFDNISVNDLFVLLGNVLILESEDNSRSFGQITFSNFNDKTPTFDAVNYFRTKNEAQLSDKFTDYVYTMAETLTRDYVQTTFIPSEKDFGNLPSYLSNVSEANTGLDYVNDASSLSIWNDRLNDWTGIIGAIDAVLRNPSNPKEYFAKRSEIQQKYQKLSQEIEQKISEFEKTTAQELKISEEEYQLKLNNLKTEKQQINFDKNDELNELLKLYSYDVQVVNLSSINRRINSSYFGKIKTDNNGYFKDKWEKEAIGIELYDPKTGESIEDNTIRLKDLDGKKVTSRPRAFFLSQLYNYGVGDRTVSGIYRNKNFDALALYGYVKNEDAKKIDRLKFTDIKTGEVKYLRVNVAKTNNIFYFKKQGDPSSKVTLADEGYSTWISDYALMGKYRDALLFPGHSFTIEFVDNKGNELKDKDGKSLFTLGHGQSLTENGKDESNAPIKISQSEKAKAIVEVDLQFNVIR